MKGLRLGLLAITSLVMLIPAAARADGPERDFWSLNVGMAYPWEDEAFSNLDSDTFATYVSGTWGWGPAVFPDWIGVEAELGTTAGEGLWMGQEWSLTSGAAYLSATLGSEDLYLKLRGGVSSNRADIGGFTSDASGLAGSMGVGFRLFGQPLELNFTAIDRDVNTLTLHWQF